MKQILIVIAQRNFRDEELLIPNAQLQKQGFKTRIASLEKGPCQGTYGAKVDAEISISDACASSYDAIVIVGGSGTLELRSHLPLEKLLLDFAKQDKVIAAICFAPTILAKTGLLKKKKATVWVGFDDEYAKETPQVLEDYGGIYVKESTIVDGKIITGSGHLASLEFAQNISQVLKNG